MNTSTPPAAAATLPSGGRSPARANPVLWMVIGLPLLAVLASFGSLALALSHGDRELPSTYHWEGNALDRDDARRARAQALGLRAALRLDATTQRCVVRLQGMQPESLRLDLTHPTEPGADRHLLLQRSGDAYSAACTALPAAHWWVQLSDPAGDWLLRARAVPNAAADGTASPLSVALP